MNVAVGCAALSVGTVCGIFTHRPEENIAADGNSVDDIVGASFATDRASRSSTDYAIRDIRSNFTNRA